MASVLKTDPAMLRTPMLPESADTYNGARFFEHSTNARARLNLQFMRELWLIIQMATGTSLCMLGAQLALVFVLVIILLCVLPVPNGRPPLMLAVIMAPVGLLAFCVILHSSRCGAAPAGLNGCMLRISIGLLVGATQVYNVAGFFAVLIPSYFYGELTKGEQGCPELVFAFANSLKYFAFATVASSLSTFAQQSVALLWRESLTKQVQDRYLNAMIPYQLKLLRPSVDNPDQRIAREVDSWATCLSELLNTFSQSLFSIVWYSVQTWQVIGWRGPAIIYCYFLVTAVIAKIVASPISALVAHAEAAEGDFRHAHLAVHEAAEDIAFCGEAQIQHRAVDQRLRVLLHLRWRLIWRHLVLSVTTSSISYGGSMINYIAIASAICSGSWSGLSPSEIASNLSLASGLAISLVYGFTQVTAAADLVSQLAGHTRRVAALLAALDEVKKDVLTRFQAECTGGRRRSLDVKLQDSRSSATEQVLHPPLLQCSNLVIKAPSTEKLLLQQVNLTLHHRQMLLVTGASGCGKTSILRTVRGLWPVLDGLVECVPSIEELGSQHSPQIPGQSDTPCCVFIPSYNHHWPDSTLRELLTYPCLARSEHLTPQQATEALEAVQLPNNLVEQVGGLDMMNPRHYWSTALSPGQRQLLCLARLFIHRPALAVLDEATSAVPVSAEAAIYKQLKRQGIAVLTIGHRHSLESLHDSVLHLTGVHEHSE